MKTLLFCTSFAESLDAWNDRWGRWLKAVAGSGVVADKILIVDDGSPVLPTWNNVAVLPPVVYREGGLKFEIHHFPDCRGLELNGEFFPGWYRSFLHAVSYATSGGFDRIVHIAGDAFLISDNAVQFFNTCDLGWVGLWRARARSPERGLQIINKDQFAACEAFFSQPYQSSERSIPFTSFNKTLIGNCYGETTDFVPFGADYVSQVRWNAGAGYYWWLSEDGGRPARQGSAADLNSIVTKYSCDDGFATSHAGVEYRDFMRFMDQRMLPRAYLEVGTQLGESLLAMECDAICIDPVFHVYRNVLRKRRRSFFFQMTSDDFFESFDPRTLIGDIDLGFLDGLHHFEALLKDFTNFERNSHSRSLVLLHDCLPLNLRMAGRVHQRGPDTEDAALQLLWTGDVWRILPILRELRPDLTVMVLDCPPTGLVLCSNLSKQSTSLIDNHDEIVKTYATLDLADYGLGRLWTTWPMLSSRKIVSDPQLFCDYFGFHA